MGISLCHHEALQGFFRNKPLCIQSGLIWLLRLDQKALSSNRQICT